jgi:acetyltransferase-like isoleucine patch superfamily enzyme
VRGAGRIAELARRGRVVKYLALSTCRRRQGAPTLLQPVLFLGDGEIVMGERVEFGWPTSMGFHTGYSHIEACHSWSRIVIGDGVQINNDAVIKCEGAGGIVIGEDALIGSGVRIYDSDFHDIHPARRRSGTPATAPVVLERNVFVGDGVMILKGVTVGEDAVIGAGAVVTRDVPPRCVVAGNPARVVRELDGGAEEPAAQQRSLSGTS